MRLWAWGLALVLVLAGCPSGGGSGGAGGGASTTTTRPQNAVWPPRPGMSWQIQLQGTLDTSIDVQLFFIDLFDVSTAAIDELHADGKRVVCYFSAGTNEDWRTDKLDVTDPAQAALLGSVLGAHPNERYVDIRDTQYWRPIIEARMDLAVEKGCDAIDPDNVDAWNIPNNGLTITAADQLQYNRWLATEGHERGMLVGLKNDLLQVTDLVASFDFMLNESCYLFDECQYLTPFISQNKPVFGLEYTLPVADFCADANSKNFDFLKKDPALLALPRVACR